MRGEYNERDIKYLLQWNTKEQLTAQIKALDSLEKAYKNNRGESQCPLCKVHPYPSCDGCVWQLEGRTNCVCSDIFVDLEEMRKNGESRSAYFLKQRLPLLNRQRDILKKARAQWTE